MTRPPLHVLLAAFAVLSVSCSTGNATAAQKESAERPTAETSADTDQSADPASLDWRRCADQMASLAGLQCATLDVPLDPDEPTGSTVALALVRQQSTGDQDERIGSLIMNPGGPGGSGIEFLAGAAASFPESLTDRFDLVSWDPRGVGDSDPVRCLDDDAKDRQLTGDLSPDTPEEHQRADAEREELRQGCEERNPKLITHMSTADVAADLDRIREAVGDERLTYLGFSYGTSIGAAYATEFPEQVRAMVLDGSVSPSSGRVERSFASAQGFERTLASFVEACDAEPTCALAPDAAGAIAAARSSLETDPIEVKDANGTRTLGSDLFNYGLATSLYDSSTWGPTAQAIAELRDGGAATILTFVDRQTGRQPDGSYDNSSDAQVMVNCADSAERLSPAEADAGEARIIAAAPTFGSLLGTGLDGCTGWPQAANPVPVPNGAGAPPILVVGTIGDPATPYEWAQEMATALASGVLLTYEGTGHTAFLRGGECIEDAVVDYLVDLTVPATDTRCPAQDTGGGFQDIREILLAELEDGGLPSDVSACIVDGMIDAVGEARFNQLVLENNQEEITKLGTAQTLRCATGGG